jgi:hypothetical protein
MLIQRTTEPVSGSFDDVNNPAPGKTRWDVTLPGNASEPVISCGWEWHGDTGETTDVPQIELNGPQSMTGTWAFSAFAVGDRTVMQVVLTYYVETDGAALDLTAP